MGDQTYSDTELFNSINDIYDNICKYYLEDSYGCNIEHIEELSPFLQRFTKRKNKVEYKNFMYSDKYDENDTKNVKSAMGKKYMNISIIEALILFGNNVTDWPDVVKFVGKWYEENIHTYQGSMTDDADGSNILLYEFELDSNNTITVRDDCTGFVTACVLVYIFNNGLFESLDGDLQDVVLSWFTNAPTSDVWDSKSNTTKNVENLRKIMIALDFEELDYTFETIQPFDIMSGNKPSAGNFHHAEIYAGEDNGVHKSWAWGSIHDGSYNRAKKKHREGMPCFFRSPKNNVSAYHTVWRKVGLEKITDKEILFG